MAVKKYLQQDSEEITRTSDHKTNSEEFRGEPKRALTICTQKNWALHLIMSCIKSGKIWKSRRFYRKSKQTWAYNPQTWKKKKKKKKEKKIMQQLLWLCQLLFYTY